MTPTIILVIVLNFTKENYQYFYIYLDCDDSLCIFLIYEGEIF